MSEPLPPYVQLDGSVEIVYQDSRIARFDSKTAHRIGLYGTNGRGRYLLMDQKPLLQRISMNYYPDIFTLQLT